MYILRQMETLVSLCSLPTGRWLTFCVVGNSLVGNSLPMIIKNRRLVLDMWCQILEYRRIVCSIYKQRLEDVNSWEDTLNKNWAMDKKIEIMRNPVQPHFGGNSLSNINFSNWTVFKLQMRSNALPVVAATINGIALRVADIAEFKPRVEALTRSSLS